MGVFSRGDLDVFTVLPAAARLAAIEERLHPKLSALARDLVDELAVTTGEELHAHLAQHPKRKKTPPEETWVALGPGGRNYKKEPFFAVAVSQHAVHVRVQVLESCARKGELGKLVAARSDDLARNAQQMGALRDFTDWDHEGLPDPAPAAEPIFWSTLGNRVADDEAARFDIGVGWKGAEALRITTVRIAEAVARLMPLYHLLAFERWRF